MKAEYRGASACAIDIGSMMVKARSVTPGASSRCVFPTRIAMGLRELSGHHDRPLVLRFDGDDVRVGDCSSMVGFSAREVSLALAPIEAIAVLITGAFAKLRIHKADVLLIQGAAINDAYDVGELHSALSHCGLPGGVVPKVGLIGTMSVPHAVAADFSLTDTGAPRVRKGAEEGGRFAVADFGSSEWRIGLVSDASQPENIQFGETAIAIQWAFEKHVCERIEREHRIEVRDIAEMISSRRAGPSGKPIRIKTRMMQSWRDVWPEFGSRLLQILDDAEISTLYASGANADLARDTFSARKDIDFKIANECEFCIVNGLLKAAKRWGKGRQLG